MWIGASLNKPHIDVKYMSHVGLQTKGAKIAISSVKAISYSLCEVQHKFHKTPSGVGEIFQSHYSR